MTTRAVLGFLVLAGLVGAVASLDQDHLVALGDSIGHAASAVGKASQHGLAAAMTASGGALAYYDENGNWQNEPCYICDAPPQADPSSQGDSHAYLDPSYVNAPTIYYGGPLDPDGGGTPYYGSVPAGLDQMYSPPAYDPPVYYNPPVTIDPGYSISQPLYDDDPIYIDTGVLVSYDTWYEQAFPGWGNAVVPLLPPIYRPASYPTQAPVYTQPTYVPPAYTPPASQPDCTLTVTPSTIDYDGSVTVSWVARNATRASLNGQGAVALSGSHVFSNLTTSQTFGVTVTGQGGVGACYGTVAIRQQQVRPTCQISAHPAQIIRGQSASLAWVSQNANFAMLSNLGTVDLSGGRSVAPSQTTNYLLSVTGRDGLTGSCSTTVFVQ